MNKLLDKKIFFVISSTNELSNQWLYHHFIDELGHYNIGFEIFNVYDYEFEHYQEILIKEIKSKQNNITLFLTALQDHQISVETIDSIKSFGIPTVLICYDNLIIPFEHKNICKHFDLVWLTSFETEFFFKKWGAKTIFLPYAANPYKFFPTFYKESLCVGFIGSLYGSRKYKIKVLDDNHISTNIYGRKNINLQNVQSKYLKNQTSKLNPSKHEKIKLLRLFKFRQGRILIHGNLKMAFKKRLETEPSFSSNINFFDNPSFEEMNQLYSEFAISLGIIETWNTYLLKKPLFKVHLRTFEIPMCGGLQITNRTQEMMSYFEDNKEIILYDTEEEMIDKIKFYLADKNDGLRLKMKQNARLRAENEHTWKHRFTKINQSLTH